MTNEAEEHDGAAVLAKIEADPTAPSRERGQAFRKAHELFAQQGDRASAEIALSLHIAFSVVYATGLERFSAPKARFSPVPAEAIAPERWQHLRVHRDQTHNPAIRARLSDLLWDARRDPASARDAVSSYLAYAAAVPQEGDIRFDVLDALLRSLEISVQLHDKELTSLSLERALALVRGTISGGSARWAYEVVQELLSARPVRDGLPLDEFADLIESALGQLAPDSTGLWERNWLLLLERLGHVAHDPELTRRARLRLGESRERVGDSWEGKSALQAIRPYQEAAEWFRRAGGSRAQVARALRKLEEATEASHSEMKLVSASAELSGETVAKWQAEVLRLYEAHGISVLAASHYVLPDVNRLRDRATRSQQEFPLSRLFPHAIINQNRIVRQAVTPEEHADIEFVQDLVRGLQFQVAYVAVWVFGAIHDKGGSVRDEVMAYVQHSPVIRPSRYALLDLGLERYSWADYPSCVHLLIFQIEGILRDLAHWVGLETTVQSEGLTSARLLHEVLRDPRMEVVLGDRLTEALKAVLVDRAGLNARNLVAHGLVCAEDLSEELANLLIVLLLQVATVRGPESGGAGQTRRSDESGSGEAGDET